MKNFKFLSLCLGLMFVLSSFTESSFVNKTKPCWTQQNLTITNNGSCDIIGTWGNQTFWIGAGNSYSYLPNGSFVKVCITQSECEVDVSLSYTLLELCGKLGQPSSISEICSSSATLNDFGCKTFTCLTPG